MLSALLIYFFQSLPSLSVIDFVDCHDVSSQDLRSSRVAAHLGDDNEGHVFHLGEILVHVQGHLQGGLRCCSLYTFCDIFVFRNLLLLYVASICRRG